jgi:hypothetical protein
MAFKFKAPKVPGPSASLPKLPAAPQLGTAQKNMNMAAQSMKATMPKMKMKTTKGRFG